MSIFGMSRATRDSLDRLISCIEAERNRFSFGVWDFQGGIEDVSVDDIARVWLSKKAMTELREKFPWMFEPPTVAEMDAAYELAGQVMPGPQRLLQDGDEI